MAISDFILMFLGRKLSQPAFVNVCRRLTTSLSSQSSGTISLRRKNNLESPQGFKHLPPLKAATSGSFISFHGCARVFSVVLHRCCFHLQFLASIQKRQLNTEKRGGASERVNIMFGFVCFLGEKSANVPQMDSVRPSTVGSLQLAVPW